MFSARQDLPSFQGLDQFSNIASRVAANAGQKAEEMPPAAPVELPDAVNATEDTTSVDLQAQTVADLQALVERLSAATTEGDVKDALTAVKQFVNENTNATMIGGAIHELGRMAEAVLHEMAQNPNSGIEGFSFAFGASFSQQSFTSDDYVQNTTSFSFNFSFSTPDSFMQGSMSFDEQLTVTEDSVRYKASENVTVRMVTFNADMESNPVLDAFTKLTKRLTGVDLAGLFEHASQQETPELAHGGYRTVSSYEKLQLQYQSFAMLSSSNQSLIDMLYDTQESDTEEVQDAEAA